jgi:cytochrome P450
VRKLTFVRNVLKEALRLYPPITFLPRVAAEATTLGGRRIAKGTMVMIAPWSLHRHERLWRNPDRFDPDRFTPEREHELPKGAYIPFGTGPRVCIGAAFATLEATLVVAELVRSYEWKACAPDKVWPLARLTTRPTHQIECQIQPVGRP